MSGWREELQEIVKTKAEREAEEDARQQQRLQEALVVADDALAKGLESLRFAEELLRSKQQPCRLDAGDAGHTLTLHEQQLQVVLCRDSAVLKVTFNDSRPREFDFAQDRHTSPRDVEDYMGRRAVELARAAQQSNPW